MKDKDPFEYFYNLQELKEVVCVSNEGFCEAILLKFVGGECLIKVCSDTDELTVEMGGSFLLEQGQIYSLTLTNPWVNCIGQSLLWAWLLRNQQGYTDAIQFQFHNHITLQLVSIGSELKLSEVGFYQKLFS